MIKRSVALACIFFITACSDKPRNTEGNSRGYKENWGIHSVLSFPVLDAVIENGDSAPCPFLLRVKTYENEVYPLSGDVGILINTDKIFLRLGDKKQKFVLAVIKPENQFACNGEAYNFGTAEIVVPDQETLAKWKKILTSAQKPNIVVPRLE